jgi:hypothetical protein
MKVSGLLHTLITLPPGKEPMDRKLDGSQSLCGRFGENKNLAPASNRTPAVQPLARRYTAVANLANL